MRIYRDVMFDESHSYYPCSSTRSSSTIESISCLVIIHFNRYGFTIFSLVEPTSYHEANVHQEWHMAKDIVVMERTSTWDIVPVTSSRSSHQQLGLQE
jgi:hypothetical protein